MTYTNLLFFFATLGVFNVIVIAAILITRRKNREVFQMVLGLLLLSLATRVSVSCFYFFERIIHPTIIQIGMTANVLSGVLLYVLMGTGKRKLREIDKQQLFLVPVLLLAFGLIYPFSQHFQVWDWRIRFVFHGILTAYLIAAGLRLRNQDRQRTSAYRPRTKKLIYIVFVLQCLSFATSLFVNYILGPVLFSLIFYAASIYYFFGIEQNRREVADRYANKKIAAKEATALLAKMDLLIYESHLYTNKNLKVADLAQQMQLGRHQLSQLLNDNLGIGFSDYINRFRIEKSKDLLLTKRNLSIEGIGYESGFNSKSTFFTTFKKYTGLTPKHYIEKNSVQD